MRPLRILYTVLDTSSIERVQCGDTRWIPRLSHEERRRQDFLHWKGGGEGTGERFQVP